MKKSLFIFVLLLSCPAYSLCSIDEVGESVCSLTNFNNTMPIFKTPNADNNLSTPQGKIQPMRQEDTLNNQLYESNDSIMKYNSGCQFGICVQDLNNTKNKNQ